ncbi:MAG: class I SAM-dependent methyltransferase [Alphaproteobacteria bacterium]|nr:class I SAM-dependent methyltransferase [Alphaproteobacteria bacterium]
MRALAALLGRAWGLVPAGLRRRLLFGLLVLESRAAAPRAALGHLLRLEDDLDLVIDERATALGGGEHPKHRLTRYADYFVGHIGDGDRVLDIGCGRGIVARAVAAARPKANIVGVDIDARNIAAATAGPTPENLRFVVGDATAALPEGEFDVVILSNVLEHLDDRPGFLRKIVAATGAHVVLIRVPLFERDWRLPMRKELGLPYVSDPDHRIEHTIAEFASEVAAGGLTIAEQRLAWGEIWALCLPDAAKS